MTTDIMTFYAIIDNTLFGIIFKAFVSKCHFNKYKKSQKLWQISVEIKEEIEFIFISN